MHDLPAMRGLPAIRKDINAVDAAIRELFLLRMSLALEVAQAKVRTNDVIYKPDREAEIIRQRATGMDEELRLKYVALLQNMICASRECQYSAVLQQCPERFPIAAADTALAPATVYYQGVPGAYQELAARALFPACEPTHVPAWTDVFQAVRDGVADVGVVPVENSTAGTVSEVYDLLLEYDLFINRSYIKRISHCLAATPGSSLDEIQCVYSHPHALPQCHTFIRQHGFAEQETANTAMAAEFVQTARNPHYAAICSREAAERCGLAILAEEINDLRHNETRFIAISRTLTSLPTDNRIAIAFRIPHVAGSLEGVLRIFADYGIDLTSIQSRPVKDSPWRYVFYIDFIGNIRENKVQALLYQLHEELPYSKVIGSYAIGPAPDTPPDSSPNASPDMSPDASPGAR